MLFPLPGHGNRDLYSLRVLTDPNRFDDTAGSSMKAASMILDTERNRYFHGYGMSTDVTNKIRVLVVDDSLVIREVICDNIKQSPDLEVAGTAADGEEALRVFESARPDVVTLDIHMPNMDGLATLDALLANKSVPVIMVSALTQLGAEITFEALDRGAMDYVAKPDKGADAKTTLGEELLRKIRNVAGMDVQRILRIRRERKQRFNEFKQRRQIAAVQEQRRIVFVGNVHCHRNFHRRSAGIGRPLRGTSPSHAADCRRATHAAAIYQAIGMAS